jgi:hypothetical protein
MEADMNKGLKRHNFLKAIGFCLASSIPGCASAGQSKKEKRPSQKLPNIVLIMVNDLGYGDFGCYNKNSKIPTADEFESHSRITERTCT